MIKIEYPDWTYSFLSNSFEVLSNINKRLLPIENVHNELDKMSKSLKTLIKIRETFLKEENVSVINLSTVVHSKILSKNGNVIIKVQNVVFEMLADDVLISDNFDAYAYSIVKINNSQKLKYSSELDTLVHKLVTQYKLTSGKYIYKVGNRIELKTYGGSYAIVSIDDQYATITCKKWKNEGKPNRTIKVSDIKGLASNNLNSLTWSINVRV